MNSGPPDSWIESPANGGICDDAGYCPNCHEHLDSGRCSCSDEEINSAPDPCEEAEHDRGEQAYLDACEDRDSNTK